MQQQYNGESLEHLVLRVKNQWGNTAKIIKAEKIRPSGLRSFGGRDKFSLLVEIPDIIPFSETKPRDRFKSDHASRRESELVRNPAEMALLLARAYGEDPKENRDNSTNLRTQPRVTNSPIEQPNDPKADETETMNVLKKSRKEKRDLKRPLWSKLTRDSLDHSKPSKLPKSSVKIHGQLDANGHRVKNLDPEAEKISFKSELNQAQVPVQNQSDNDVAFNQELLVAATSRADTPTSLIDSDLRESISNKAYLNRPNQPSFIDLTKSPPQIITSPTETPDNSTESKLASISPLKETSGRIDHVAWLETRISDLTKSMSEEIQADLTSIAEPQSQKNTPHDQIVTYQQMKTLIIGDSAVINEGLHYLFNNSNELSDSIEKSKQILINSKDSLTEIETITDPQEGPELAVASINQVSNLNYRDFVNLRHSCRSLNTYLVCDSRWSNNYVQDLIQSLGGSRKLCVVIVGSTIEQDNFDFLGVRVLRTNTLNSKRDSSSLATANDTSSGFQGI